MILAIDIDGVLRDFTAGVSCQYKKDYIFKTRVKEIFTDAPIFDGAKEFIQRLKDGGHYVLLLTTQPAGAEIYTLEWLYKHETPYDSLCFSGKKGLFVYEVFLDDGEHNLEAARREGRKAVCFNQPWNQRWDGNRVYSYKQFIEMIGENGKAS